MVCEKLFLALLFSWNESQVKKLSNYTLLVSDSVVISNDSADIMTKMGKTLSDVAYNINDNDDDDEEDESEEDTPSAPKGDAKYARKLANEQTMNGGEGRRSSRLAGHYSSQVDMQEGAAKREKSQIKLMTRRNEERLRELARENARKKGNKDQEEQAEELEAYKKTTSYPEGVQPNQVKVDMATQCVILPICGNPIPFHISTIKNVVLPDPDNATLLRINFYSAGMAVGKDAPANMAKLVQKIKCVV